MKRWLVPFLLIICLLFSSANLSFAQNKTVLDSLENVLQHSKDDSNKVLLLNLLLRKNYFNAPHKAKDYGEQALKLAQKISYKRGLAQSLLYLGNVQNYLGDHQQALSYYERGLNVQKELNDDLGCAKSYNNMGNVYREESLFDKALDNYLKALGIFEKVNNKTQIGIAYNNIAIVCYSQGEYQKALDYNNRSLEIKKELKDRYGISASLNNMGLIYQKQNKYEQALSMFEQSYAIDTVVDDPKGAAQALYNIGMMHFHLNHSEKALIAFKKSIALNEKLGAKYDIINPLIGLGQLYQREGNNTAAIKYLNEALSNAKQTNNRSGMRDCYESLSRIYERKNDYKKAYEYHRLFSSLNDTLLIAENSNSITRMEARFESEKKDRQIELLKKDTEIQTLTISKNQTELNQQRIINYAVGIGLFLVIVLMLFIYNGYRNKKKANEALETAYREIEDKNTAIEAAYNEIEEKNKDITDSINYARRIQTAILPAISDIQQAFPQSFVLYMPKDIVSGDFYYFTTVQHNNRSLHIIAAGDCTGHGVPGAFMSMIGNDLLNQVIIEKGITTPATILDQLHDGVTSVLKQDVESSAKSMDGMDIALCCFDPATGTIEYAGANRPLILIDNKNELQEIKADKQPIGGIYSAEKRNYTNHKIKLQKGDSFYISSDGYADQFGGPQGKKYMTRRFKHMLLSIQDKKMDQQKTILKETITGWINHKNQENTPMTQLDDILVIGVKI